MDRDGVADFFGMSRRWVEYRISEGMPSHLIGANRRYRVSECEDWLRREGYLKEDG